jgi:adenylate cyclase
MSKLFWLKSGKVRSIAFTFATSITLLVLLGMGAMAALLLQRQAENNQNFIDEYGDIIAHQLADSAVEPLFTDEQFELQVLLDNVNRSERIIGAVVFDHAGRVVAQSSAPLPLPLVMQKLAALRNNLQDSSSASTADAAEPYVVHISPIRFKNVTGGYVAVVFSHASLGASLQDSMSLMIWIAILLAASISLLGVAMGHQLSKPIQNIAQATQDIRNGNIKHIPERRNDELGQLIEAINHMSDGLVEKSQVEALLKKFTGKDIAEKVLGELDTVELGGEQVEATVLFADIVGFTSMSEKISPAQVSLLLNEYYNYFQACAKLNSGSVDKFIGDCAMITFGASKQDDQHRYHAVACAVLMSRLATKINAERSTGGQPAINLRIGINSGKMLAGLMGTEEQMQYTVVGDAVNLASRLCNEAEAGQIIIEASLYESISKDHAIEVTAGKQIRVRGKQDSVAIYNVLDIDQPHGDVMESLIDDIVNHRAMAWDQRVH